MRIKDLPKACPVVPPEAEKVSGTVFQPRSIASPVRYKIILTGRAASIQQHTNKLEYVGMLFD
ncbi:MAG: hypothetical protein CO001_02820 [Candidatus Portnoybacteria bacterium CG_4_8_14_3_um_filter_40_10]|uniref:Uncharacterized protein n=2 Tax=Candidatus Portnoyibacteriota TaxID=1817913 RepID=A0A2M7II06_9BACT|nr:MAG: hypothetical protein COV84_01000 [Candidatus Portnoybacteria bacterium CG11_big_fil_rev_8_21_14_0_20_40_15]PIS30761.1 MAG: hypothetical protein COT41_02960 [Candidatus Portnoybacteria bacterium CG08_land_8_20_14_0_20_40_83]PIW76163.1 MAG: hypothetical protein CO001_02820 [Candidatus Portnoybacteria bacterium CG_4_8_14_3_um_filter_40_10]